MNTLSAIPVKQPHIDLILDGTKTWEIRRKNTKNLGEVGLIKSGSGTVVGTGNLVKVIQLTAASARANSQRMGMIKSEAASYAGQYAWELENIIRLRKPVPYVHPRGAIIWVTLDPTTARKVKAEAARSLPRRPSMGREFLAFWRLDSVDAALRDGKLLNYGASGEYSRVEPGDTVWFVSVRNGRLRLIGRVVVDRVTDRDGAIKVIGAAGLWSASHYILAVATAVRPVVDIDIHHLVPDLRFSSSSDRLTPGEDGLVSGRPFQKMRLLAGYSAQLLADALGASYDRC
jgi:predicted transcriptional regulator